MFPSIKKHSYVGEDRTRRGDTSTINSCKKYCGPDLLIYMTRDSSHFLGPTDQFSEIKQIQLLRRHSNRTRQLQEAYAFTLVLSDPEASFCRGIIRRQWDKTTNLFGKILNSPLLVLPNKAKRNHNLDHGTFKSDEV